jgi:hypothetical protein
MKPTLLLSLLIILSSCHTLNWAKKGIEKRDIMYPEVVASICASRYNPIDSVKEVIKYLPGQTITKDSFITVNCDSLKKVSPIKIATFKIPCPSSSFRVDTFFKDVEIKTSNKGQIYLLNKTNDSLFIENNKIQNKLNKRNSQLTKAIASLILLIAFICIIIYKKIIK